MLYPFLDSFTFFEENGNSSVFQAASSLLKAGDSGYPLYRSHKKGWLLLSSSITEKLVDTDSH